ncbi:MAG: GIY-YIG nuclease family protein [Bacillota bacterium]
MRWWVYVIECESGAWYTGVSNDVERRFRQHADSKGAKYFRLDHPKRVVAGAACADRGEAQKLEASLKKLPRELKREWIRKNPYSRV